MSGIPRSPTPSSGATQMIAAPRLFGGTPIPELFANQLRLGVTITDFTLIFGSTLPQQGAASSGEVFGVVSDKVALHLAPGMLKQLLLQIEMAVAAYETVMGSIKIPDKLPASLARHKAQLIEMLGQQMEGTLESG